MIDVRGDQGRCNFFRISSDNNNVSSTDSFPSRSLGISILIPRYLYSWLWLSTQSLGLSQVWCYAYDAPMKIRFQNESIILGFQKCWWLYAVVAYTMWRQWARRIISRPEHSRRRRRRRRRYSDSSSSNMSGISMSNNNRLPRIWS